VISFFEFHFKGGSISENIFNLTPNHGLRTPRELFFKNLELLGLGRHFGLKFFEAFGVFLAGPCPCFPLFNHYFYKKLSLDILLQNIYLGVGFEFEPQRI